MKKKKLNIAICNWNGVNTDLIEKLKGRGHKLFMTIEEKDRESLLKQIDVLITWNEVHQYGNDTFLEDVKSRGIKTILVQHGRRGTSRIFPPFNEKLICDLACLWSENDKQRLMSCGNPEDRIKVTGTPIFRKLKPREKHEGINVVFSPEHWGDEVPENNIVASFLRKIPGVNIITKVLNGEHTFDQYDNVVASDRNSPDHFEIVADVLSKADVVVAISESTFELLAQSLDIPVIIADIWIPKACQGNDKYKEIKHEFSNACVRVKNMKKMEKAIKKAIKHPEHLREERRRITIDDGGTDIENPVDKLIEIIEQ